MSDYSITRGIQGFIDNWSPFSYDKLGDHSKLYPLLYFGIFVGLLYTPICILFSKLEKVPKKTDEPKVGTGEVSGADYNDCECPDVMYLKTEYYEFFYITFGVFLMVIFLFIFAIYYTCAYFNTAQSYTPSTFSLCYKFIFCIAFILLFIYNAIYTSTFVHEVNQQFINKAGNIEDFYLKKGKEVKQINFLNLIFLSLYLLCLVRICFIIYISRKNYTAS